MAADAKEISHLHDIAESISREDRPQDANGTVDTRVHAASIAKKRPERQKDLGEPAKILRYRAAMIDAQDSVTYTSMLQKQQ